MREETHRDRGRCNINVLLMDYRVVSAGLSEGDGPPDARPLFTAGTTHLNYSSDTPPCTLPVLTVGTTEDPCYRHNRPFQENKATRVRLTCP